MGSKRLVAARSAVGLQDARKYCLSTSLISRKQPVDTLFCVSETMCFRFASPNVKVASSDIVTLD